MIHLLLLLATTPQPADLVLENARIWSDGRVGFAEFAAVRDGAFVHVGAPDERYVGEETDRVDAGGRTVLPGLIDSHVHMLSGGLRFDRLHLRDAASRAEFIRRVADWTAALPPGRWVLGGRWSTESWADPQQPTREWVDPITGDRPLFLTRMDGHSALANSAALHRAGITRAGPPDPEGGIIDRDPATGEPTGILRESAMALVADLVPAPTAQQKLDALRLAAREAVRHGITAVSDIPALGDLEIYERLARRRPLIRFFLYPTAPDWSEAAATVRRFEGRPGWVEVRGFKAYLDGSLGSRTAWMHEPYFGNDPGEAEWRGLLREGVESGRFRRNVAAARDAGLQVIAHAIGDEANHLLLETLEEVFGPALGAARCRSEHAQHLRPRDIERFGRSGVIASMQPFHKADDGRYAEAYIGSQRARSSYAYKSLLDAGAVVSFGSDWPVVTLNPFRGVEAAVTGRTLDGRFWQTQENITVGEALRCYTSRAAWAAFAEESVGRIAPGRRADFIILNRSPFATQVEWESIAPVAVYVEGRRVGPDAAE